MKILALEFSPHERSSAVFFDGEVRGFSIEGSPQGARAFELIQQALAQARISAADVECIAVSLGPGSYAGTRIAIAIAQGWELARGVKLLGISSADSIAQQINTEEGIALAEHRIPFRGIANIVFDAQRDHAYAIRYQVGANGSQALGGFELLTSDEERQRRDAGETFVKADMGPWRPGKEIVHLSDARAIARIAAQRKDFVFGAQLEPVYLRKAEFIKALPPRFNEMS
jgi:tRNA threonylcarbamoyladenosine biosynthesis protein TsaB